MSSTPFAGGIKFGRKRFLRSDARGCGKVLGRACGFEGGLIMRGIWSVVGGETLWKSVTRRIAARGYFYLTFTQTSQVEVSGSDIARFEVGGSKGIPSFRATQG
jgi:hypothetical protein